MRCAGTGEPQIKNNVFPHSGSFTYQLNKGFSVEIISENGEVP